MSDTGHLSNHTAASYLANWIGNHTKYVVLAHLSEHNNTEALAYEETKNTLEEASKKVEIKIAKQHEPLSLLEV